MCDWVTCQYNVKSILPGGLAAEDGVLQPGDVLVRVNGELLLGASQSDACRIFVNIPVGDPVAIQVCRGYPLLLDPSNRIITENVYQTGGRSRDLHEIEIIKGSEGFGFTIADSATVLRFFTLISRTPAAEFRYGEQGRANTQPTVSPRSKTPAPLTHRQESDPNMPTTRAQTLQRQPNVTPSSDVWDGPSAVSSRMRPSSTTLGFATPNYMPISAFQFNKYRKFTAFLGSVYFKLSNFRPSDLITVNLIRKPNGFGFRLLGGSETSTQLTVGQVVPGGAAADDGRMQEGDEIIEIDGRNVEGVSHVEAVSLLEQAAHSRHVKLVVRRPRSEALRRQSVHAERPLSGMPTVNSGEYDVTLTRNETDGFGFIIISSLNRNGSTIGQILENSPAEKCGRLKVGDRVVAVNGIDILNLTHGEIVGLIKASGLTVRLTIAPPMQDGGPLASSTLNRSVLPNSYISSPPATFVPPPPTFQNGGYYATLGRDSPIISVELERGARGFGFSIRGGQEFGAMPLFVLRIAEDGPAAIDGRLKVGDQLISINGRDTKGLTHEEAIQLIKQHPSVRLTVRRHKLP
ncbi:unnamed protein product [Haemonchus placei]|uniref:PDZ domain-containing protein n=1 Tax=Haemonchus placei TaxID=6290 RepID=A0A0N4WQI9_HAEPC|nr:unnamed protein product [Haemonchus placei]